MISEALRNEIEKRLSLSVLGVRSISGGCIAHASILETSAGRFFLKWSDGEAASTFEAEAAGLEALRRPASGLRIPKVEAVASPTHERPAYLVLEFISEGRRDSGFFRRLGHGLAALHAHKGHSFGFHTDNFIGRLPQCNDPVETWPAFFRTRRLEPQVKMARDRSRWNPSWDAALDRLYGALDSLLPARPDASLVHGDLWSGNVISDEDGTPVLVDPATYYGDGETDLAMAELFGGFPEEFFSAYYEVRPPGAGYEQCRTIYQLYHLINHLNHFGGTYASSVAAILRQF